MSFAQFGMQSSNIYIKTLFMYIIKIYLAILALLLASNFTSLITLYGFIDIHFQNEADVKLHVLKTEILVTRIMFCKKLTG